MIFWEEAEAPIEQPGSGRSKPTKTPNDLLALVPTEGTVLKKMLIIKATDAEIGENKARGFLEQLISEKTVFEWRIKRPGTNPEKSIGRQAQPEQPDLK